MSESPPRFVYAVHGLTIASVLECPELPAGHGPPHVEVRYGTVPTHLDNPRKAGVLFEVSPDSYLLRVDAVARYWARAGREIVIEPTPDADAVDVRTFLFGPVINALLHQRGALVLHAGGVVGPRGALLVAGESGRGKSTAVAALANRGYQILTDDVAAIVLDGDDRPLVWPGSPQLRLWPDAIARLGYDMALASPVRPGVDKFTVDMQEQFSAEPQPLGAVYLLEAHNGSELEIERLENSARFDAVRSHTRNFRVIEGLGMQRAHFRMAAAIAARVPVIRLKRPRTGDSVDAIAGMIDEALQ